jgi:ParB/RepB/Spo0J family partition protein
MKMKIKITEVKPSPDNAEGRSTMNEKMEELVATIKAVGVVEPITVFPRDGHYEIIEGERRWFAAKKAGLKEVDVYVREDVDEDQARLMRLASLTNEPWAIEAFSKKVWEEITQRDITHTQLAKMTGLSVQSISNAFNFELAKLEGCVVEFDGDVKAQSSGWIYRMFTPKDGHGKKKKDNEILNAYDEKLNIFSLRKAIAKKASTEKLTTQQVRNLCARTFKALPNVVAFGEPDDDDYEEHNFEVQAIIEEPFRTSRDYEPAVEATMKVLQDNAKDEWETARFDEKVVKKFVDDLNNWVKSFRNMMKTPAVEMRFSFESAQFTLNKLKELQQYEIELIEFCEEIIAEKKKE